MPSCTLKKVGGQAAVDYQDTVTQSYESDLGQIINDFYTAMGMAQGFGPAPLPQRGALLAGTNLFASISGEISDANRNYWNWVVTFSPPPDGESEEHTQVTNPLLRPPIYNIDYVEREYVIKRAKNVQALGFSFETGIREANTLGPIVNGSFRRPDEPLIDTERLGVVIIERNYATLGAIMALNIQYQRTTNSDVVTLGGQEISAYRLKYLITKSQGRQSENGIEFYPGVTEIAIEKTTDTVIDNVGYEYWDSDDGEYKRAKDANGDDTADPINLKLDGTKLEPPGAPPVEISYRHLNPVQYSGFFS